MSRLTESKQWETLQEHYFNIKNLKLKDIFEYDEDRFERFSFELENITFDLSKNRINFDTINHLISLAKFTKVFRTIPKLFDDNELNSTEKKAVLHTALRDFSDNQIHHEYINIKSFILAELERVKKISDKINAGEWLSSTGDVITDVVYIGIGGSFLGPKLVTEALTDYHKEDVFVHFVSNIDDRDLNSVLPYLEAESTLFILCSKSFETEETLTNGNTAKLWLADNGIDEDKVLDHFISITTQEEKALKFGIKKENILEIWDWVGGRFSVWSAVGLPIAIQCGYDVFEEFLKGAESVDKHFCETDAQENIPILLALIDIWHINFHGISSRSVFTYNQYLEELPNYIQQLETESNAKRVDKKGEKVDYNTAVPVWGGLGTNMQHSVFQMIHQGTSFIPVELIAVSKSNRRTTHNRKLLSNFLAQSKALMNGKQKIEVNDGDLNKVFSGNIPSTSILIKEITPKTIGALLAVYEHKVFTMGLIWNINSFDQFGVELGKEIASDLEAIMTSGSNSKSNDSSTDALLKMIIDDNNY